MPDGLPEELYSIWKEIPEAHKWLHYFEPYAAIAAPLRHRPIRMLEIGVYKGASVQMWRKYLHPQSVSPGGHQSTLRSMTGTETSRKQSGRNW